MKGRNTLTKDSRPFSNKNDLSDASQYGLKLAHLIVVFICVFKCYLFTITRMDLSLTLVTQ
jgi:hypothetical protein